MEQPGLRNTATLRRHPARYSACVVTEIRVGLISVKVLSGTGFLPAGRKGSVEDLADNGRYGS